MENAYFLNAGVSPAAAHFEPAMQSWNSFTLAQELSCSSDQTSSCSLNPNWDKQFDHFTPFDSPLSTLVVPSPLATGPPPPPPEYKTSFNGSCFSKPLNSPAKPQCGQSLNQFGKEMYPNMTNSLALNPILPDFSVDPGFVERAAKFSCFGSRSFNGRISDLGSNNTQLPQRSNNPSVMGINKLQRVWSTPTLKQDGFQIENKKLTKLKSSCPNSNEESSISEQVISCETVSKTPIEVNSRKRKAIHRAKPKEESSCEASGSENGGFGSKKEVKNGDLTADDEPNKEEKANLKTSEATKDYIHVRARRGQATDSHSLAERVRREKIGERMKLLQDLVPGCNKVTGKALMLDEIINYVKSLQGKVEFLSMKLASVNPMPESNMDNYNSKDEMQQNSSFSCSLYPIDPSVPLFHGHHQPIPRPPVHSSAGSQCPVEMDTTSYHNLQVQLPPINGFTEGLPQFHGYCEDDLHSIIQMGFSRNLERETRSHSSSIPDDATFFSRRYEL